MKTELQKQMKKIRKRLQIHNLSPDERRMLREELDTLKEAHKESKKALVEDI